MGAMTAFAVSERSGSPWLGMLAAAPVSGLLGLLHGGLTVLPGVNDIAARITMIIFGSGLAFFFWKQFAAPIVPQLPAMVPQLPVLDLGGSFANTAVHAALRISPLFSRNCRRVSSALCF
jgi:ABC-type uncharacterized transport system permease subunit